MVSTIRFAISANLCPFSVSCTYAPPPPEFPPGESPPVDFPAEGLPDDMPEGVEGIDRVDNPEPASSSGPDDTDESLPSRPRGSIDEGWQEQKQDDSKDQIKSFVSSAMRESGLLRSLFGNERINVFIAGLYEPFNMITNSDSVESVGDGILDDPTMEVLTDMETIDALKDGTLSVGQALEEDRIQYHGVGFTNSIELGIANAVFNALSLFGVTFVGGDGGREGIVQPGAEASPGTTVTEEKRNETNETEKTCQITCCCIVKVRTWVYCSEWTSSSTSGLNGIGDYPASCSGASSCDVGGAYIYWPRSGSGEGDCQATVVFKKTFTAKGDDCKPENKKKFCKQNYQSECSQKKQEVISSTQSQIDQCVADAQAKCNKGFRSSPLTPCAEVTDYC